MKMLIDYQFVLIMIMSTICVKITVKFTANSLPCSVSQTKGGIEPIQTLERAWANIPLSIKIKTELIRLGHT